MKIIFLLITLCLIVSCGNNDTYSHLSDPANFLFKGNNRTDLTEREEESILSLENNCTAFWVKNRAHKLFVASAKHCLAKFDQDVSKACELEAMVFKNNKGHQFLCSRVVLDDHEHDTFIVEVIKFDSKIISESRPLKLTAVKPYFGIALEMFGYPADSIRAGRPTKSYDCMITGPHKPVIERYYPTAVSHNCSTWGGNSGGPIVLKGSDMVVGSPAGYIKGDPKVQSFEKYGINHQAGFEDMGVLIERNRALLKSEDIEVLELGIKESLALMPQKTLTNEQFDLLFALAFDSADSSLIRLEFETFKERLRTYRDYRGNNVLDLAIKARDVELIEKIKQ